MTTILLAAIAFVVAFTAFALKFIYNVGKSNRFYDNEVEKWFKMKQDELKDKAK